MQLAILTTILGGLAEIAKGSARATANVSIRQYVVEAELTPIP